MLLDVELPRVSGFKILALLRQQPQTADLPVVMVTAHAETKHILQAMSLGADGYLSKPVKVATLRAMVGRILARSR
jgi:CheY-like chemotaxis protein